MINEAQAKEFAAEWIAAWNAHDLERILAHYAEDFEMSSPFIVRYMNEPGGVLKGKRAVAEYWKVGLSRQTGLKFELENVLVGANGVTILYKNHRNQTVAEVLIFDADEKVVSGNAFYEDFEG